MAAEGLSQGAGQRVGDWSFWRPDGSLVKQGAYRAGLAHGPWVYRDAEGRVTAEGLYEEGQRVGAWTLESGKPDPRP